MADSDSSRSDARVVRHEPSPAGLFARLRWLLANLEVSRFSCMEFPDVHRSEEHTSELQSLRHLVCRHLLEKKKHMNDLQSLRHLVCRLLLETKKLRCL